MEKVLDVIKYARESYLSKENQLDVIQDAYSKWLRGESFEPSELVEAAEQAGAVDAAPRAEKSDNNQGSRN